MSEDTRRMISLSLLGVLIVLVLAATSIAIADWFAIQSRIAAAEASAELPPAADPQRYLLHAGSRGEASATLQSRINEVARASSVTVSRSRPIPADERDALRMAYEVEVSGTIGNIAAFLHAIESNIPALVISNAEMRPARDAPTLRLTVTIEARLSPGAAR